MMTEPGSLSNEEIIQKVAEGQKALYEIIVRRLNADLYKVGRALNYNHQDTEDLMQDTFVAAYRNLSKFESRSSFKTWITRIMLNNCYQKRRKTERKKEYALDMSGEMMPLMAKSTDETNQKIRKRELTNILESALIQIPDRYRLVFTLREMNGLNVAETASILQISDSNVKVRLNRAKSMLRKEIEKGYAVSDLFDFNLIYCDGITERVMREIN